jgi:hypothetical protein
LRSYPNERIPLASREVEALLLAAPQLRVFEADVECFALAHATRMLRGQPPLAPLRVRSLTVQCFEEPDEADVLSLAAAVAAHAWLTALTLDDVALNATAVLDALVDAALACRLREVELLDCQLSPASAPALARLLCGGLERLLISNLEHMVDLPAARLLGSALRESATLTAFHLRDGLLPPAGKMLIRTDKLENKRPALPLRR